MASKVTAARTASFSATNSIRIPGFNMQVNATQQRAALDQLQSAYPHARALLARAQRLTTGEQAELQALLVDIFRTMQEVA